MHYVGSVRVIAVVSYLSVRRVSLVWLDFVVRMLDLMILVLDFIRVFLDFCHWIHPPMIEWLKVPPCRMVSIKVWLVCPGRGGVDSCWECVDWVMNDLGVRGSGHICRQSVEIGRLLWHMVEIMLRLWQVGVDPSRNG